MRPTTQPFPALKEGAVVNVIFDLDGTLALCDHRRHHVEGKKKNWEAFFAECDKDTVNEPVARLFRFYRDSRKHRVWIMSGRSGTEATRKKTIDWLINNDLTPDTFEVSEYDTPFSVQYCFSMRSPEDRRHDTTVKTEMVSDLGITPSNTEVVFDDRDSVVQMWRSLGFTCFQVAPGNF